MPLCLLGVDGDGEEGLAVVSRKQKALARARTLACHRQSDLYSDSLQQPALDHLLLFIHPSRALTRSPSWLHQVRGRSNLLCQRLGAQDLFLLSLQHVDTVVSITPSSEPTAWQPLEQDGHLRLRLEAVSSLASTAMRRVACHTSSYLKRGVLSLKTAGLWKCPRDYFAMAFCQA